MRLRDKFLLKLVPPLGAWLIRLLGWTWRSLDQDPFRQNLRREKGPRIFCFWHGCLLPATAYYQGMDCCVLVSKNRDGELIAKILQRLGYPPPARGSSSRGGAAALLEMAQLARQGRSATFTPDGPRGPYHRAQVGALQLAKMTGLPVVPVGIAVSRAVHLRSWDRFTVPFPFARCLFRFGKPLQVPSHSGAGKMEILRRRLQGRLNQLTSLAEENLGK
jgi:lysophospholipid acyltransferase (LPLAT)-like uncharacterized protein